MMEIVRICLGRNMVLIFFFVLGKMILILRVANTIFRKMDAIHAFAREGDGENLLKCIEGGVPVNLKGPFLHFCSV